MGQKDILMECALYIRSHAKEPLSVQGLAEQFGYSAFHFSRMFREEMGVTLMDYAKQQRLFGAAREIREGRKILDTALDYGYETHSGFTHCQTKFMHCFLRCCTKPERSMRKNIWRPFTSWPNGFTKGKNAVRGTTM